MTNHVLLDNVTHKDLRVSKKYEKGFGFDFNVARVLPSELIPLQMEYPLFFIKNSESGQFETVALLGFSDDENLYLGGADWDASYVPLTMERQPFLIGFQEQDEAGVPTQVPVVHIDLDHPSVNDSEGERVFLEHGGASPFLERMTSVLMTIYQGDEPSQSFSQLLVGLELIESLAVDIEFDDGSRQGLAGLYTINEDKLRDLNANALDALHQKGHLQDIYMMLASMPNLEKLVKRKNKLLSA